MIKIGSKVRARPTLNPVQTFSIVSQGLNLNSSYIVLDIQNYLGIDYIKFAESKHWQTAEWFERNTVGFALTFDF